MDPSTPEAEQKKGRFPVRLGLAGRHAEGHRRFRFAGVAGSQGGRRLITRKTSAMDGVYKVPNDLGEAVNKDAEDFREKRVFDFADQDPDKVELHAGAKAYFLTRSGEDWWEDGKKMDPLSVQEFLRSIRTLTASKFETKGFSSAEMSLVATSQDGKRVEKVEISKNGSDYLAKRSDGPSLFVLDAKAVDDIQKAADGLKPAEVPPVKK